MLFSHIVCEAESNTYFQVPVPPKIAFSFLCAVLSES